MLPVILSDERKYLIES